MSKVTERHLSLSCKLSLSRPLFSAGHLVPISSSPPQHSHLSVSKIVLPIPENEISYLSDPFSLFTSLCDRFPFLRAMLNDTPAVLLLQSLIDTVSDIACIRDFRRSHRRECTSFVRRVKLLIPLLEEAKELPAPESSLASFVALEKALLSGKEMLQFCRDGSKIYLVLAGHVVASKLHAVTGDLEKALDSMPWDVLEVTDEVKEQVELVHSQLKRAKGRVDTQDSELLTDVMKEVLQNDDRIADPLALQRLADKLQLRTHAELGAEFCALQRLVIKGGSESHNLEQSLAILRRLKILSEFESSDCEALDLEKLSLSAVESADKPGSPAVPDDFKCPITLEMMTDPVIIATGQTYERASIQKWMDSGLKTCPKTGQILPHLVLTPNDVLRSVIAQWCKVNGIEVPRRACPIGYGIYISPKDRAAVDVLVQKLSSRQVDLQRSAAEELRLLAKRNASNRVCIAEAGAIPLLVGLLATQDSKTQEHAVTALLNLSNVDCNKGVIVQSGAIGPIVEVLKHGSMEARENAAATLFILSLLDENKVLIGGSGAILALVDLLRNGTSRGKKDAATALFSLSIYQANKPRAVRAGVVKPLMELLVDPSAGMVDEALAILAILATHPEGKMAIGKASAVQVLVDLIQNGSSCNKENAAAVLLALSMSDPSHLVAARKLGAQVSLTELAQSGTARARRKASSLLEYLEQAQLNACL